MVDRLETEAKHNFFHTYQLYIPVVIFFIAVCMKHNKYQPHRNYNNLYQNTDAGKNPRQNTINPSAFSKQQIISIIIRDSLSISP